MSSRIVIVCLVCSIAGGVCADEVILKNGDRLTGTLKQMLGGSLTIATEAAGDVAVKMDSVQSLATDQPITIHLIDGTVLVQQALRSDDGLFAIPGGEGIQAQAISAASIAAINPPAKPPVKWTGNVTAGVTKTDGNTKTLDANISAVASRRSEDDRTTVKAAYMFGEQEDPDTGEKTTTKDAWWVDAKYDYFVSEKLYTFLSGRHEKDRIADLAYRTIVGAGAGYQWLETDRRNFSTEAGLSWLGEKYDEADERNEEVSVRLGYHFDAKMNPKLMFIHEFTIFPAVSDLSDYYLMTDAELRATLTGSMFASFKVVFNYDATPATGNEKEDITYILGVGMNF